MAYTKTTWVDRSVEKPRTYQQVNNVDGTVTLNPVTGTIYNAGTPVNATNLNKIEEAIYNLDTNKLDANKVDYNNTPNTVVLRDTNNNTLVGNATATKLYVGSNNSNSKEIITGTNLNVTSSTWYKIAELGASTSGNAFITGKLTIMTYISGGSSSFTEFEFSIPYTTIGANINLNSRNYNSSSIVFDQIRLTKNGAIAYLEVRCANSLNLSNVKIFLESNLIYSSTYASTPKMLENIDSSAIIIKMCDIVSQAFNHATKHVFNTPPVIKDNNSLTGTVNQVLSSDGNGGLIWQTMTATNADTVDGYHLNQDVRNTASPSFVNMTLSQANGTAPMTITSTTKVNNLNVDKLDGYDADINNTASTIVVRDSNKNINVNEIFATNTNEYYKFNNRFTSMGVTNYHIANNATSGWAYINTDTAQKLALNATGSLVFSNAPSGNAGDTITFTDRLTVDTNGNLYVTGILQGTKLITTSSGTGYNIQVGDDAYIGDINVANTIGIKGTTNTNAGYIQFGAGGKIGFNGSGGASIDITPTSGNQVYIGGKMSCSTDVDVYNKLYLYTSGAKLQAIGGEIDGDGVRSIGMDYTTMKNVGFFNNSGQVLYVTGTQSDAKLKENIVNVESTAEVIGLELINKINHVAFDFKQEHGGNHVKCGVIAQELEQLDKGLVCKNYAPNAMGATEEDPYLRSVNHLSLLTHATYAIQQLSNKINELESRLNGGGN